MKRHPAAPARTSVHEVADAFAALGRFSTQAIGGAMGVAIRRSVVRAWLRRQVREVARAAAAASPPQARSVSLGCYRIRAACLERASPI
jgi:hypothetical protein